MKPEIFKRHIRNFLNNLPLESFSGVLDDFDNSNYVRYRKCDYILAKITESLMDENKKFYKIIAVIASEGEITFKILFKHNVKTFSFRKEMGCFVNTYSVATWGWRKSPNVWVLEFPKDS